MTKEEEGGGGGGSVLELGTEFNVATVGDVDVESPFFLDSVGEELSFIVEDKWLTLLFNCSFLLAPD